MQPEALQRPGSEARSADQQREDMDFILGGGGRGAQEPCGGLEVKSTGFADGRHGVEGEGYQGPGIHRAQQAWHKVGIQQVTQMKKKQDKLCDVVT